MYPSTPEIHFNNEHSLSIYLEMARNLRRLHLKPAERVRFLHLPSSLGMVTLDPSLGFLSRASEVREE